MQAPAWVSDAGDAWALSDVASLDAGAPLFLATSIPAAPAPAAPLLVSPEVISSAPIPNPPKGRVATLMESKGFVWREGTEKFTPGTWGTAWAPFLDPGTEWIAASPPFAAARAAILRTRVEAYGTAVSATIGPLSDVSATTLYQVANDTWATLADKSKWAQTAERLGVPVSKMGAIAKDFEAAVNGATTKYLRLDVSSLFADLKGILGTTGEKLAAAIQARIRSAATDLANGAAKATGADKIAAGLGDALAIVGPVLKAGWDTWQAQAAAEEARRGELYTQWMGQWIFAPFRLLSDRALPVPWHVPDVWSLAPPPYDKYAASKWDATADMVGASRDYRMACAQLLALPLSDSAIVRRWWATSVAWMGDARVRATFSALCRSRSRTFGGSDVGQTIPATDELVACVGVPIAVANGLDPWTFVRLLWGYSDGWGPLPGAWTEVYSYHPTGLTYTTPGVGKTVEDLLAYQASPTGSGADPSRPTLPGNAWALNLASLTRTAYALAEAMNEPVFLATAPSKKAASGGAGPIIAAGLGLGALLFFL
jgi:hypothetical protein